MYCIKRLTYSKNKSNINIKESSSSHIEQIDINNFNKNKDGIYVPNNTKTPIINKQNILVSKYAYIKYPYESLKDRLIKAFEYSISEETQKGKKIKDIVIKTTEKLLDRVTKSVENLDENPIQNQSLIPKLHNIDEISKIFSVTNFTVDEKYFIQDLSSYIMTKSFFYIVKQSPLLMSSLIELEYPIYKKIVNNLDNISYTLSISNLKKAMYPLNSNMPLYFSNEGGVFRDKECLQIIECVNSDVLHGYFFTKTIKGAGDAYNKNTLESEFRLLELKTADLPQLQIYNLLSKIQTKYSNINDLIICFDVSCSDQQYMVIDYLNQHQITNVTSIFINNSKFFGNTEFFNHSYGLTNPVDEKTFEFFYNKNFKKNYLNSLEKDSLKNNNKINLLEIEDKLDQLVDPKILDIIDQYQEVGNIMELIDRNKYNDFDNFEFNDFDSN